MNRRIQMILRKREIGIWILSLGTCLMFLNPLNLNNEVYPYFLLAFAFLKIHLRIAVAGLLVIFLGFLWLGGDPNSRSIIDATVLTSMLVGCSLFDCLKDFEKLKVANIFFVFLLINFIICFIQFLSPEFQSLTNSVITAEYRNNVLDTVRARNGGVTGLAPEPAYGAALVVGLGLIVSAYKPEQWAVPLLVIGSLLLLRSVTGFFYGSLYLVFVLIRHNWSFSYQRPRLGYMLVVILAALIWVSFENLGWARFGEISGRLINFVVLIFEYGSFLEAEATFGSNRISSILYSFSALIIPDYQTGFSPAAAINFLTGSASATVFLAIFLMFKKGRGLSYLFCLVLLFIAGPKLVWPIFYFALFGTENIKGVRNAVNQIVKAKVTV